jgi:hypothetical protein
LKTARRRASFALLLALVASSLHFSAARVEASAGVVAYVLYSGSEHEAKSELLRSLPGGLRVRAYNVDLLRLADYSAKQKIVARMDRARVIIVLEDGPMEALQGVSFNASLIVVNSQSPTIQSETQALYLVSKDADLSKISTPLSVLEIADEGELGRVWRIPRFSLMRLVGDGHYSMPALSAIIARFVNDFSVEGP